MKKNNICSGCGISLNLDEEKQDGKCVQCDNQENLKDYIIVDSSNNWLSSSFDLTEKEAIKELRQFKKETLAETLYLFEVKEIKRIDK